MPDGVTSTNRIFKLIWIWTDSALLTFLRNFKELDNYFQPFLLVLVYYYPYASSMSFRLIPGLTLVLKVLKTLKIGQNSQ